MLAVFYAVTVCAIAVMISGLVMAVRLRRVAPGGKVGRVVSLLVAFIALFLVGYLVSPLLPRLPAQVSFVLVSVVFLLGAVYVVLVLWLIGRLVHQVMEELDLRP